MKRNNIKLAMKNGAMLSLAQHYDDDGELLCNELAMITDGAVGDPVQFFPSLNEFLEIANNLNKVIKAEDS